jgi:hypothetical protein
MSEIRAVVDEVQDEAVESALAGVEDEFQEALEELVAAVKRLPPQRTYSVREKPVQGTRKGRGYERRCLLCKAAFLPLAPGKTQRVGVWTEKGWYCSEQCFDEGGRDETGQGPVPHVPAAPRGAGDGAYVDIGPGRQGRQEASAMSWWNESWGNLEPETSASIRSQPPVPKSWGTTWACGCEESTKDEPLLHLCDWHLGFDEGVAIAR